MNSICIPERYNYIGIFLTLDCNLNCPYCLNIMNGGTRKRNIISSDDWASFINRLEIKQEGLPVTLQGGEPGVYPEFIELIKKIREDIKVDILTNLTFDVDRFISEIPPERINREAPYAPIRVSYHAWGMDIKKLVEKILKLMKAGFRVGLYGLDHPEYKEKNEKARKICEDLGIDFRIKEFLGYYKGKLYGTYKYQDACVGKRLGKKVLCRTSELLIDPEGKIFRCHYDLYTNINPIGSIFDEDLKIEDIFRPCENYGLCNPCDVKLKTNRFQIFGHCSVEILFNPEDA